MKNFSPAVSVIVPVYNAEKYLPACLESILIQTLTDFEVIVVDDCSTDSSADIAESYLASFGGRLKVISLPTNTGSGAVPRNVGLDFARGKYVFFMDADDLLVDNALEELFNAAETFDADFVNMEYYFEFDDAETVTEASLMRWGNSALSETTLESDNLADRVEKVLASTFSWMPWTKFVSRNLLVNNQIKFPRMKISEDAILTIEVAFAAKRLLRVPTPLYLNRASETSMIHRKRTPQQAITFWTSPLINGFEVLDGFMRRIDYFNENPRERLRVLHFFGTFHFNMMQEAFKSLDSPEVYEIFMREFSSAGSSQPALISYLLFISNIYRNELMK